MKMSTRNGMRMATGYLHPYYANSLSEFGNPRELPHSGGWILERQIPGSKDRDAMGCYPLFFCRDWSKLALDLEGLGSGLVSLAVVTDPFGSYDVDLLQDCFTNVVIPFKTHYVIDLGLPLHQIGGKHAHRHARRALKIMQVKTCEDHLQFVDTWSKLYDHLIKRHNLQGIKAFSRTAFAHQVQIPGTTILYALYEGEVIGAQVYFLMNNIVYCHLGALSSIGYDLGAFYALDYYSIEYFSGKAQWLDLGGGAGLENDSNDGLSRYKQGWSTETRTTYFCGRIFNRDKYNVALKSKNYLKTGYFPAYRQGEFE